jgi:thioredoxin 1
MKIYILLVIFLLSLAPPKIVVVSNSIDHSPELIEFLQKEFEVISIAPEEFSSYQNYEYFVVLGGPDAPEGTGDIVENVLSWQEKRYLRSTKEYDMFIRVKDGKTYFVLAGADREQTELAVTEFKDDVLGYIPKEPISWMDDLDKALQKAKEENKLVYIDFYTNWCRYCMDMHEETYTDPRIIKMLAEDFVPVKINREDPANKHIITKYNIYAQPIELVISADGEVIWGHRGYIDADELYYYLQLIV